MSNVRIFTRINKSRQVTPSLPLSSEEQLPVINPNPTGQAIRHNSTLDKNGGDPDNDFYGHNTEDIQDALEGSNLPSAINVFVTVSALTDYEYISNAPNDGKAYARKSNVWTQLSPYDLKQEGATDGQALVWSDANNWYEPATVGVGGNKWTDVGGDIYRNSQVTIGKSFIISADLGIKQNNATSAFRIDGLTKTTRRTILSIYEGSTLRHTLDNHGIPVWDVWSGVHEAALSYSTPLDRIGIITASNRSFNSSERGEITWSPLLTTSTDISILLTSRNTHRIKIGATGNLFFGVGSLSADNFFVIKPTSATYSFTIMNSTNTIPRFRIKESDGSVLLSDSSNIILGGTTGTKIGTTISEKLAFWDKTPIIQPTTGIVGSTRTGGAGTAITDTDTFGGYTIAQLSAILINTGLTA